MSQSPGAKVLVVDDDTAFAEMVADALAERGYGAESVTAPLQALERLAQGGFAAAVVDLLMPQMSGLELADRIHDLSPDTQVVILTGQGDLGSAVEGLRRGVFDFLQKSALDLGRLARTVEGAVEKSRLTSHNRELLAALRESNQLLKALHAGSTALTAETHLDRLLVAVVNQAKELCRAGAARAVLFDQTRGGELVISAAAGDGAAVLLGVRLHPGRSLFALALESNATAIWPNPETHPRFDPRCDALPTERPGLVCAPLSHRSVAGVVAVAGSRRDGFGEAEQEALGILARHSAVAIANAQQHERAVNFFTHASDLLVEFIDAVDVLYPGHSRGVALLADMVTRRLGLSDSERRSIHFGALLHDIGKVRLDPAVLRKPGPLSEEARLQIEQHPALGLEILRPITLWEEMLAVVHAHHERWDGKGYPRRLAGEEIPLGARVVAVADSYDASARPAPHARERQPDPVKELEAAAGSQFDPRIVRLFVAELRERGDPRAASK